MSPGSGTFRERISLCPLTMVHLYGTAFFFSLYLGELGGLRGREKGSEGYQRECLLN